MRAALLTAIPTRSLALGTIADPVPAANELLVAVEACGVCGTDLHVLEGTSYRPTLPFVLGHEPVGRVIGAGAQVDGSWVGQHVTCTLFTGCGRCELCQLGDERLCPELVSIHGVLGQNGGFAEQMTIRAAQAVAVPDGLTSDAAASLVDAGATATNTVRVIRDAPAGPAVVVGGGPVGFYVAELLRAEGRDITIVQPSATRREMLAARGYRVATALTEVLEDPAVVVDCAGAPESLPWAVDRLRPRGQFVAAGYGPVDHLHLAPAARKELLITGVRSGRREDLERILDLVARGMVSNPPLQSWPLEAVNDAIGALRERKVPGKALIHPTQLH